VTRVQTMLHDAAAWLLRSPRRLLALTALGVGVLTVGAMGLDEPTPATAPVPASSPVASQRTSVPDAATSVAPPQTHTEHKTPARPIKRAAVRFLDQYVIAPRSQRPAASPRSVRALSTPSLWRGLRLADPAEIPRGMVTAVHLEAVGPYSGTATAELDTGAVLAVTVVAWNRGWRVADVKPAEAP
jgi:hypothetical protein